MDQLWAPPAGSPSGFLNQPAMSTADTTACSGPQLMPAAAEPKQSHLSDNTQWWELLAAHGPDPVRWWLSTHRPS